MALEVTEDELVKAIRYKLGIPVDNAPGRSEEICAALLRPDDPTQRGRVERLCRFLADFFEDAVRCQLGLPRTVSTMREEVELLDSLWKMFQDWLRADERKRSPRVSGLIRTALSTRKVWPVAETARKPPPAANPVVPSSRPAPPPAPTRPTPPASAGPAPAADSSNPTGAEMTRQGPDLNRTRSTGSQWQYKPIPENEPDPHPEAGYRSLPTSEGWTALAARVRGKKHKHEGTNCDDWFEVATTGRWTLIAVSDGAGSKTFSRIGARASCQEAIRLLVNDLTGHQLRKDLALADLDDFGRIDETGNYVEPELEYLQSRLHNAMRGAYFAVEKEMQRRAGSAPHERLLPGRKLAVEDFSATLLLAIHTTLIIEGRQHSLVMACQIGDGALAALDDKGTIITLGKPDSGDYSGETDFLTSRKKLEPASLRQGTFLRIQPLRALFVMTDGVADDYFPPNPGMARLYADLVLNGILPVASVTEEEAQAELSEHGLPSFDVTDGRLDMETERVTAEGSERLQLRSGSVYASELGLPIERVAASAGLLRAGTAGTPLLQRSVSAAERLHLWLDSYQVRGSFDDRTLVVLHPERG